MNMQAKIGVQTRERALEEALRDLEALLSQMQDRAAACLPEGDRNKLLADLLSAIDGPEQRKIQARAQKLLGTLDDSRARNI